MKTAHAKPMFSTVMWAALGLLATAGATLTLAPQSVSAQEIGDPLLVNPLAGDGSTDPFSDRGGDQMNSLFDLIHRANFSSGRSLSDFRQSQQESIDSAASDFRTRQQQLLQQQAPPAATPGNTSVTPAE